MQFIAVDVETANHNRATICQIGLAHFQDGRMVNAWDQLINPEAAFDACNVQLHGIDSVKVRGHPTYRDVAGAINKFLDGNFVVAHNASFDREAIHKASIKYRVAPPNCRWLDSMKICGGSLADNCEQYGVELKRHHHAGYDAKACGEIFLAAARRRRLVDRDLLRCELKPEKFAADQIGGDVLREFRPEGQRGRADVYFPESVKSKDGEPDGPLYGHVVVFSGNPGIQKSEATDIVAKKGCDVRNTLTNQTTVLIVGDGAGQNKIREARERNRKGQGIEIILGELDFRRFCQRTRETRH
jgi:DNA polymerase-3 subunit epsilon